MLSILIPTYNYNVYPLVYSLQKQCADAGIAYEIIVLDDGSKWAENAENEKINLLPGCTFRELEQNIGRSSIRNLLAQTARYDWLLFLDADTMTVNDTLISGYIPCMNNEIKIVYGGIEYQKERPAQKDLLRWIYGNGREVVPADERNKEPYLKILTLNFLIHKKVFEKVRFNESIPNLRHEDTLFSYNLSQAKIKAEHINNTVCHLGLESSEIFIRKEEQSAEVLNYLTTHNLIDPDYVGVSRTYKKLKNLGLLPVAKLFFTLFRKAFYSNLKSNNPSLFIFDVYRLGYFCSLKQ